MGVMAVPPHLLPAAFGSMTRSSTRRFFARPSAVALSATGRSGPKPCATSRSAGTPRFTSAFTTAAARRCESARL